MASLSRKLSRRLSDEGQALFRADSHDDPTSLSPEAVASKEKLQSITAAVDQTEASLAELEGAVEGSVAPAGWDEAAMKRISKTFYALGGHIEALMRHLFVLDQIFAYGDAGIKATRKATVLRIQTLIEQRGDPAKKRAFDLLEQHKALRPEVPAGGVVGGTTGNTGAGKAFEDTAARGGSVSTDHSGSGSDSGSDLHPEDSSVEEQQAAAYRGNTYAASVLERAARRPEPEPQRKRRDPPPRPTQQQRTATSDQAQARHEAPQQKAAAAASRQGQGPRQAQGQRPGQGVENGQRRGQAHGQDGSERSFTPRHTLTERAADVVVSVELPGVDPDDVAISWQRGGRDHDIEVLVVAGRRASAPGAVRGRDYPRVEAGRFEVRLSLPRYTDTASAEARFEEGGVLHVTVPKMGFTGLKGRTRRLSSLSGGREANAGTSAGANVAANGGAGARTSAGAGGRVSGDVRRSGGGRASVGARDDGGLVASRQRRGSYARSARAALAQERQLAEQRAHQQELQRQRPQQERERAGDHEREYVQRRQVVRQREIDRAQQEWERQGRPQREWAAASGFAQPIEMEVGMGMGMGRGGFGEVGGPSRGGRSAREGLMRGKVRARRAGGYAGLQKEPMGSLPRREEVGIASRAGVDRTDRASRAGLEGMAGLGSGSSRFGIDAVRGVDGHAGFQDPFFNDRMFGFR